MGSKSKRQLCLSLGCAPGDIVCLTALARDIQLAHPDKFEVHVSTHCRPLWDHNPHIAGNHAKPPRGMEELRLNYASYITQANKTKLHFLTAFHRIFTARTGISVPVLYPKGDLHLPTNQIVERPIADRYWLLVAGHKSDFTTKTWSKEGFQKLVDKLRARGLKLVQVGATHQGHVNPLLDGVLDLVGKTSLREALWLVQHCEGVICPITFFMHAAAAFDKPCVCIAGGREHWWWEAYVNVAGVENFGPFCQPVRVPHRYLHTQGLLDCCKERGCWKNKILPTEPDKNKSYCRLPEDDGYGQIIPKCMKMVTVDHVMEAVMSYYNGGTLPPIGLPTEIIVPNAPPPPRTVVLPKKLDLFAPPAEILRAVAPLPRETPVPTLLHAFEGEQKRKMPKIINDDPFDHPIIGGKMTICILMYGDYPDMQRSCLGSILATTAPSRRELRIVTNQLAPTMRKWLDQLKEEGHLHTLIHNEANLKKYPAMRQLFYDENNPITTNWIVWFDDDTIANRDPQWYTHLVQKIIFEYPNNARMVGDLMVWTFNEAQLNWARSRPWWKGRHLQTKQKAEAPNGQNIFFAAGGFWALNTAAMREAMIPDPQIGHNGGDYMVGLQLWQQGYRTAAWNARKAHVWTSSVGRRGLNEIHTGMPSWKPGGVPKKSIRQYNFDYSRTGLRQGG